MKKLISLFCILLILSSSISLAAELSYEEKQEILAFERGEVGESIVVNVKSYEPEVLDTSLVEQGQAIVFAYLQGSTLGSFLGVKQKEPFYGIPPIKNVNVRPSENTAKYVRTVRYLRPRTGYSLDNLGTLVIGVKEIPKEEEVPTELVLNMTAIINFESERFGFGEQDLILNEKKNEKEWLQGSLSEYSFWTGRGYLRANKIGDDNAEIVLYDGALRPLRTLTLRKGEISSTLSLFGLRDLVEDRFRIKLNDVINPQTKTARVKINGNEKVLTEGMILYPGSSCTVDKILRSIDKGGVIEQVNFKGTGCEIKQITKSYGEGNKLYNTPLKDFLVKQGTTVEQLIGSIPNLNINDFNYGEDIGKFSIKKEIKFSGSLKQLFDSILSGEIDYYWLDNKIYLKKKVKTGGEDPCEGINSINENEDIKSINEKKRFYCSSIEKLKGLSSGYSGAKDGNGILWGDNANYWIGRNYEELANELEENKKIFAYERAIAYYKLVSSSQGRFDIITRIDNLNSKITGIGVGGVETFQDKGTSITLELIEVVDRKGDFKSSAIIEEDGYSKKVIIGNRICNNKWDIKDIKSDSIIVQKLLTGTERRTSETLGLGKLTSLEGCRVKVSDINLNKEVYVTILPGSGMDLTSKSSFILRIPIEKRPFKLSPEKIDDQIDKTEKLIEKLDNIIKDLNKVVETWRATCLITFAFLTLKNSFFSGTYVTNARHMVMRGIDGKGGIVEYCNQRVNAKAFDNFDACIQANSDNINQAIDEYGKALDKVYKEMDEYSKKKSEANWFKDVKDKLPNYNQYGKYIEEDLGVTKLRDWRLGYYLQRSPVYSIVGNEKLYNFTQNIAKSLELNPVSDKFVKAYTEVVKSIEQKNLFQGENDATKKDIFTNLLEQAYHKEELQKSLKDVSSEFKYLNLVSTTVPTVMKKENKIIGLDITTEKVKVELNEQVTVKQYYESLNSQKDKITDQTLKKEIEQHLTDLNNNYQILNIKVGDKRKNADVPILSKDGRGLYYNKENKQIYVSNTRPYGLLDIRDSFAEAARAEFYPDGKPYCVPYNKKGDFVTVLEYYPNGEPKTVQLRNVGTDGLLCTRDDVILKHETELNLQNNLPELRRYINHVNNIGKRKEGEEVPIAGTGKRFFASYGQAKVMEKLEGVTCYDVMNPSDCIMLFNICDPVMCPPSRFNLGGTWNVDNVVQTGIIGSLVLGWNNGDYLPICLTGILAGLQNIKSVLEGYVNCLKESKINGQSVGICDKIRSIFICQMLWKEAIAIFNVHGGILNWLSGKVYGGGTEYLNFKTNMQNAADSVKFFTKEYATTAFAAYTARSTEEIGSELCKSAIYGKFPYFGEIWNQLKKPEIPPQFIALLTEYGYSETQKLSRYNVYYHIYAGENQDIEYSVFLKRADNRVFYMSQECGKIRATINKGEMADYNIVCVADTGFNEVCVMINGVLKCGFGKVTSEFSLNYIKDLVVEDEALRKISSVEECVPGYPTLSPSLSSLSMPGKMSMVTTGIVRICSVNNPGAGTNPGNWVYVGSCGKDKQGVNLGGCWLDLKSVSLNDASKMKEVDKTLRNIGITEEKLKKGIDEASLLDKEKSIAKLDELRRTEEFKMPDGLIINCENYKTLINGYNELNKYSIDSDAVAESLYKLGLLYYSYAKNIEKCGKKEAKLEEKSCTQSKYYCCKENGIRGEHFEQLDSSCYSESENINLYCSQYPCCPDLKEDNMCPNNCKDFCYCELTKKNIKPTETCKKEEINCRDLSKEECKSRSVNIYGLNCQWDFANDRCTEIIEIK